MANTAHLIQSPSVRSLRHTRYHVARALASLEQHYSTPNIALGDVAVQLGLSDRYLGTLIRSLTGMGFRDHLRQTRIKHAVVYLTDQRLTLKEVAWKVGYWHVSNFARDFKRETGRTPLDALQNDVAINHYATS